MSDAGEEATRTLDLVRLSSVEPENVAWLWRARIPRGKVTLLVGDPGCGKSYASLAVAAAITRGFRLPDDDPHRPPARVIMWQGEDGIEDTIRPRAEKAGVDLDRVEVIRGALDVDGRQQPFGMADLYLVARAIEQLGDVAMVVVDPIASLLSGVDSYRDAEVRASLQPIADLARVHRVAVLAVMHLRKAEAERALYRIGGSIGFVGLARSVLLAAVDPESGRRAIAPIKSSLSEPAPPIEYRIDAEGRWAWCGIAEELTADHLLRGMPKRRQRSASLDEAKAFLEEALGEGARPASEIAREATALDIPERTLKRARRELAVVSTRIGGAGDRGEWLLSLPAKGAT